MEQEKNHKSYTTIIWVAAFILANFRGTVLRDVLRQAFHVTALPWIETLVWMIVVALMIQSLRSEKLTSEYLQVWKRNPILIGFISVAILSIFWSISFQISLIRSAELLCSALIAAYLGIRYLPRDFLNILFKFGTVLLIIGFVLAVFLPIAGAMMWEPYNGAWRGIYWHKNHFGGIAALFNMIFLTKLLDEFGGEKNKTVLNVIVYVFSIMLIYFSKSAAAYMLFVMLNFMVLLVYTWLKIRHHIKPIHYYSILGLFVIGLVGILANLDIIFGIFGRDTTLTGRSGLWSYLIQKVVAANPWFGYGFGAIWSFNSFRVSTQQILGWGFPVVIGDNGFLDILLHVGVVGFVLFLGVLLTAFWRFVRYVFSNKNLLAFFPLFVLAFALLANISFSFFLEVESFVWLIFAATLFSVTKMLRSVTS